MNEQSGSSPDAAYRVVPGEDGWALVSLSGTTIMRSRDKRNMQHYAELLNRAWSDGYRNGYREAHRKDT